MSDLSYLLGNSNQSELAGQLQDTQKPGALESAQPRPEGKFAEIPAAEQNLALQDGSFRNLREAGAEEPEITQDSLEKKFTSRLEHNLEELKSLTRDTPTPESVREESPFSDKINDSIRSHEELDVYKKADLEEGKVNNRDVLKRGDFDLNQRDDFGQTNQERMQAGKAPIGSDGQPIQLHHIGQKDDAPLAELTKREHLGNYNDMHDHEDSEIDRSKWPKETREHWQERAREFEEQPS